MQRTTISKAVHKTVVVGNHTRYGSPLTITATGSVYPSAAGADAIIVQANVKDASIDNAGSVTGGTASTGGTAGIGIDFLAPGTLTNTGTITGGLTESGTATGGVGVQMDGGIVGNGGFIAGGSGYSSYQGNGSSGGAALIITDSAGLSTNTGHITGGAGGYGYNGSGAGGVGVQLIDATLSNTGTVTGGAGGQGYGGAAGGGTGVDVQKGAALSNSGLIVGGLGGYAHFYGAGGGTGVDLTSGVITNTGTIIGGAANDSSEASPGNGGTGVDISGGTLITTGAITGGAGGVSFLVAGGYAGGTGLVITGGSVYASGYITGGAAEPDAAHRYGGAGVYLDGGTLTTSATISGGAGSDPGLPVEFGSKSATLVLDAGASFAGLVAAKAGAGDQLRLAGDATGTLTGLGTEFTGFAGLTVDTGAAWSVIGDNTLGTTDLSVTLGALQVEGTLTAYGHNTIQPGGTLAVTGTSDLRLDALTMAGGTLSDSTAGTIAIGETGGKAGLLTIADGAGLHGFGTIAGAAITDDGALVAAGGELYTGAIAGSGVAIIQGAVLDVQGAITVTDLNFQDGGKLIASQPGSITSTINGFGTGDVIDLQHLNASTLSFLNGTLTIDNGTTPVATLLFNGQYTTANFTLEDDGHAGRYILYTATDDFAPVSHAAAPETSLGHWNTEAPWVTDILGHFGK
jgi:hypothetical protein